LLGAGVDVNQVIEPGEKTPRKSPRGGMSALLLAVMNAHWELAGMLLDAGADPNADLPGYTPLHAVAVVRNPGIGDNDPPPEGLGEMSSLEFVGKIVAAGGEINARMTKNINIGNTRLNRLGATPLFLAAHTADLELMKTLVEFGADPAIPNSENTTALMAAAGLGTRSPGEDAGTEEEVVAALGYLLELGLDINAVDDHRETAMHGAAYKNAPAAVDFLAAQGADISVWNRKNEYGWTPLTIAEGYRFGNFKPSLVTVEAIRRSMLAAGVVPPEGSSEAKSQEIY
jgi:ankyrin repeat protein